jgi:hypothetical protein
VRLYSFLPLSPTPAGGLEFSGLATPRQSLSTWRRSVLSGSWETCCVYALFFDPGRTSPPGHYGGSARPPRLPTAKAPTISQFRGSVAEPQHALFTLRRVCRHTRRKTRFRVPAQLSRTGLITRKVSRKVSELLPTSLPPFPGFPDAMANWQTCLNEFRKLLASNVLQRKTCLPPVATNLANWQTTPDHPDAYANKPRPQAWRMKWRTDL